MLTRAVFGRAMLALVATTTVASAASAALRPVVRQQADMSCGAAALATVLAWRDRPYTEGALLEILRRQVLANRPEALARVEREGVSAAELQSLAALAVDDLRIEAAMLTLEQAERLARDEAYIVHLVEGDSRGPARQHFSVVAGLDSKRGFLRADSFDGRHVFQRKEHFARSALTKRNGTRMLVLRLVYAGRAGVLPEKLSSSETASVRDIAASRLLTSLTGDTAVGPTLTVSVGRATAKLGLANQTVQLKSTSTSRSLTMEHSFGRAGSLSVQVPVSTERTQLKLGSSNEVLTSAPARLAPVTIGIARDLDIGLPNNSRTRVAISARASRDGLAGFTIGQSSTWTLSGRSAVQGQFALDFDHASEGWTANAVASVGVARLLDRRSLASFDIVVGKPLARGGFVMEASISAERSISRSLSIGISASRSLVGPPGYSSFSYGASLTYRPVRKVF